jgi:superfamily II DNA/RNA helicase
LSASYLQNPVTIEVARPNETASTIEQSFYSVKDDDKRRALIQLLREKSIKQSFVFVNSKLGCARLARSLEQAGFKATALHGDKSQDERLKALDAFKKGEVDLLVATDVAARGLDIKDVPCVFNYDIPFNAEDYIHRIGRTGRAGASGIAVSFVGGNNDMRLMGDIEKLTKQKIELLPIEFPEYQPDIRKQGHFNSGDRVWSDEERRGHRAAREDRTGYAPRSFAKPAPPKPIDPFFTTPYVEQVASPDGLGSAGHSASQVSANVASARAGSSPNIKSKKKVAALFS